ncbi:hypothetical protein SAMN05216218_1233 [Halorientalis regularis]|jgi:hypothetical protein|uniref:Glycine zipper n=1 Tax=Halorientalis regularis TaxID=660518 RepID=A0A1G7T5T1_9EURY|nr:hypothetical protein SAMN05216218_1233 [Halorientalis regularis]
MDSDEKSLANARQFAESGAKLGAAVGSRAGPVSTGISSGLGGAIGYLTGAAIDGVQMSVREQPAVTDGGRAATQADETSTGGIEIPVVEESRSGSE